MVSRHMALPSGHAVGGWPLRGCRTCHEPVPHPLLGPEPPSVREVPALTPRSSHTGKVWAELRQAGPGPGVLEDPTCPPEGHSGTAQRGMWASAFLVLTTEAPHGPAGPARPAAHQALVLCCPGGLPEVLRAVLASLGAAPHAWAHLSSPRLTLMGHSSSGPGRLVCL